MGSAAPVVLALGLAHVVAAAGVAHAFGIGINVTASQPIGLYRAVDGPVRLGDLVSACLPAPAARLATARGYLRPVGACDGHEPVLKRVLALGGDRIGLDDVVRVDGRAVATAPVLAADAAGRALPRAAGGTLAPDEAWLISDRIPHSYDSRYFGPVAVDAIRTVARPLWTF